MNQRLTVVIEDLKDHPKCAHGPTLLFRRDCLKTGNIEEFYACSACRDRKACSFYLPKESTKTQKILNVKQQNYLTECCIQNTGKYQKILNSKPSDRGYCGNCNILIEKNEFHCHKSHNTILGISTENLLQPSLFLPPLNNDKQEAQYFFSESSLIFLTNSLRKLKITKVICMGTPRLHEYIKVNYDKSIIMSILLDYDKRFYNFYDENEFHWYNMFNNYFLDGEQKRKSFEEFLHLRTNEQICLVTDPPFGCRTEPLIATIKQISCHFQNINKENKTLILPVMWIFPYFMESYITKLMPEMEMLDYKINYTNHKTYHDRERGRYCGSPVRIFTNINPINIQFPVEEGYRYCELCKRWVCENNLHCMKCKKCPSKNGSTYEHCELCAICVKPNYKHCKNCGRCAQIVGHDCKTYTHNLTCWICQRKGHNESNCLEWDKHLNTRNGLVKNKHKIGKNKRSCRICQKPGHNEKFCLKRKKFLKERYFLGSYVNMFNSDHLLLKKNV